MVAAIRTGTVRRRWAHLEIKEEIGRGTFGLVYRAWDTRLERDVALKLIGRSSVSKAFDWTRLLGEARRLAKISDERVVTVHGADVDGDEVGIWMELVEGRTLEEQLRHAGTHERARGGRRRCRSGARAGSGARRWPAAPRSEGPERHARPRADGSC